MANAGASATPSIAMSPSSPLSTLPSPSAVPSATAAATVPRSRYTSNGRLQDVQFFAQGDIVTLEVQSPASGARVNRLNADGGVEPGWPWTEPGMDNGSIALSPDGGVWVLARATPGTSTQWTQRLHFLDAAGHEQPGFPVTLPPVAFCDLAVSQAVVAVVVCEDTNDATLVTTSTVTAIQPTGHVVAGWPLRVKGGVGIVGLTPDGSVILAETPATGSARIVKLRPNGRAAPGWHVSTVADATDVRLAASGRVIAVERAYAPGECGAATSTTYVVLGADGRVATGWPRTVRGWGSDPVVRNDESLVVTSSGGTVRAWTASGQPIAGWPSSGVDVAVACYTGSSPVAAGGGAMLVLGSRRATLLNPDGSIAAGWPVAMREQVAIACPSCTPGPEAPVDPAASSAGVFVPVYSPGSGSLAGQPKLLVFGREGRPAATPSIKVGAPGDEILWVRAAPDGNVYAALNTSADIETGSLEVVAGQP